MNTFSIHALKAVTLPLYTTSLDGALTFFNDAAEAFWGWAPPLLSQRWCGSWKLFWPDGEPMMHAECPMGLVLRDEILHPGAWAIAETPDGTRRPFTPYPTLIRDGARRVTGGLNILVPR